MEKRTINIGIGTINESLQDKDGLKALTLAIILKAMFGIRQLGKRMILIPLIAYLDYPQLAQIVMRRTYNIAYH